MPDGAPNTDPTGGAAELLARQRDAFLAHGTPDLAHRRDALKRLRDAIVASRETFEQAAMADFGNRPATETALIDLGPTVQAIDHMRRHLRGWMRPERRRVGLLMQPGRAELRYQPLGVVGILSAWNYPAGLALVPLATALAAGNRAIVKASELAPATAEVLKAMLGGIFEPTEVAVVIGDAELAAAFTALPFDHLFFTGSTAVGRHVMRAAADTLTPVTLELGGKSPVILQDDADIDLAAGDIAFGKAANAGQTCIAPDYLLAPAKLIPAFREGFTAAVRASYPGGLADPNLTTIVSDRHHARLLGLLEDARARGAEIVPALTEGGNSAHPRAVSPTLVLNATPEMAIMQEEIFGPYLPVVAAETRAEAIRFVNARPRPLALYVYGRDRDGIAEVLDRTTSGNVTVNGMMLHYAIEGLPFGGVGDSGIGAYHGVEGFRRLSHAKGIYRAGRWHGSRLIRAPYDRVARLAVRLLLR
ncbi:coniferyl aldehyde dehydrogenase [Tropicimonas sediminicola]|uniref:Aldehyde dehydrogenase n=1 Tax=Tropicimonas sediminicola TaxID=1031541 RepID=A0A239CFX5_9RHOB|nr:coniferyl aldehyde dehydrogenase [Tropicimonas sediminicola]SNS19115.1 coniferyl-aldehyde dehydrogenase [Tropicimonas sediminicola]